MRSVVLILLLVLAMGSVQAYPLQGGDRNMTITLFGTTREPLFDQNLTQSLTNEILKVDVGLLGAENATYKLIDKDDHVYEPFRYKVPSSGRQFVYFQIPSDDLFKLITVKPVNGKPFNINWWATPKGSNQDLVIRYYGITDWLIDRGAQAFVIQLRVTNNGTNYLNVAPQNFTLLDQWGWKYYPTMGFDPMIVAPGNATPTRLLLNFELSLLSKPTALAYDHMTPNQVIIDLEADQGQLSDIVVYGANATTSAATAQPIPAIAASMADKTNPIESKQAGINQTEINQTEGNQTEGNQTQANNTTATKLTSLKERIAASKERLGGQNDSQSGEQKSAVGSKLNSSLNSVRERLAATRGDLTNSTQNNSQNNSQNISTNSSA